MLFEFKKSFDLIYKKNKTLTVLFVAIVSVLLFTIVSSQLINHLKMVRNIQNEAVIQKSKIKGIEQDMITQDILSRDFLKISSFNSYIERRTEEYHEQMIINNAVSSKIGFFEGQFYFMPTMLNAITEYYERVNCE